MIYKMMEGRLGNQMFQYAAMRAYMLMYHENEMILNFDTANEDARFEDQLRYFNVIKYSTTSAPIKLSLIQKIDILRIKLNVKLAVKRYGNSSEAIKKMWKFERRHASIFMKHGVYNVRFGYLEMKPSKSKNKIFMQGFESPKFFDKYRDVILQEFTPKYEELQKNKKIYDQIENTESVCVTIRRGDFVENAKFKDVHYVCTPEYFERGIEMIKKKIKNPRFFVFSDDIKWVKENMRFPNNTVFEDGNDPVWEKMRLMYSCKHFIISNSTFSWWAQYLSKNDRKIVIAPTIWKNNFQNEDIYDDRWVLIDPKKSKK